MRATPLVAVAVAFISLATLAGLAGCQSSPPPVPDPAAAPSMPPAAAAPTVSAPTAVVATAPAPPPTASSTAGATDGDPLLGKPAPDFTATAQDGTSVHLSALKGKPIIVYFYPQDETSDCTKEACSLRDTLTALGKTGAVLVGISADSLASHRKFVAHYKLPFLLVSDPDGSIGKLYGVPFQGYHDRQTIEIGTDGRVRKVYRNRSSTISRTLPERPEPPESAEYHEDTGPP
jgi:peroxiredoxin Q/BCP